MTLNIPPPPETLKMSQLILTLFELSKIIFTRWHLSRQQLSFLTLYCPKFTFIGASLTTIPVTFVQEKFVLCLFYVFFVSKSLGFSLKYMKQKQFWNIWNSLKKSWAELSSDMEKGADMRKFLKIVEISGCGRLLIIHSYCGITHYKMWKFLL